MRYSPRIAGASGPTETRTRAAPASMVSIVRPAISTCSSTRETRISACPALAQGAKKRTINDKAVGEIFNLGSHFETSIKDLAEKVKERTASDSEIEYVPYDQAWPKGTYEDLLYRAPDLAKIRNCVGYDPGVDLDNALTEIIKHYER